MNLDTAMSQLKWNMYKLTKPLSTCTSSSIFQKTGLSRSLITHYYKCIVVLPRMLNTGSTKKISIHVGCWYQTCASRSSFKKKIKLMHYFSIRVGAVSTKNSNASRNLHQILLKIATFFNKSNWFLHICVYE